MVIVLVADTVVVNGVPAASAVKLTTPVSADTVEVNAVPAVSAVRVKMPLLAEAVISECAALVDVLNTSRSASAMLVRVAAALAPRCSGSTVIQSVDC